MKYSNQKCPVCNNQFAEDDDVVVCPECGTPHHRECYIQNGECANADKHGTNEPIVVEFVDIEANEDKIPDVESKENETENPQQIVQEVIEEMKGGNGDYMLNGKHVSFYEAAIGKNQKFYIPHFMIMDKTKKAVSWNIAGFFVPLAWCLYRKMYKFAVIIFALYVLMIGTIGFTIMSNEEFVNTVNECAEEDPNFYENILLYNTKNSNVSLTEKQMKLNKLTNEYKPPVPVQIITYLITYGIRIIMGIYATNLYYKKLTKNIEKVDKLDLSADMKRSILFRKCGTLPFILVAIIGFLEWQMF